MAGSKLRRCLQIGLTPNRVAASGPSFRRSAYLALGIAQHFVARISSWAKSAPASAERAGRIVLSCRTSSLVETKRLGGVHYKMIFSAGEIRYDRNSPQVALKLIEN